MEYFESVISVVVLILYAQLLLVVFIMLHTAEINYPDILFLLQCSVQSRIAKTVCLLRNDTIFMALLWLSAPLKDGAARSVITVTTRTQAVSVTCQDVVSVPLCLSAAGLQ